MNPPNPPSRPNHAGPANASHPAIHADGLSVRRRRNLILDGVGLRLGPGVHGLLGPNGAGKSTLLRVFATASTTTEGTVTLLDRDPRIPAQRLEIRRRLGYLPQEFGVFRGYTVREFLSYAAWLREMPGRRIPAAVEEAAEAVGLTDRLGAKLRTLSGGMKQRVGIAQAIVNSPSLLLLDEPTAGLDPRQRADFHDLVRRLGRTACVVVSTHLMEDVEGACDDVTVLSGGRVTFEGSLGALTAAGGYGAVVPRRDAVP
ncbi:ATP-binding cassette domain-containing protein [Streptomyces sp. NBC_00038]|uniref:ATP-binding cassette domain-containing protein n=1 Tax=Streptomyces sp. NBC_00038 TaxID=2903615 RepID=UPI0022565B9A|nr:ATP-binding cassette domain-containing protein [Streptomyces sp. NBC_00038]MCX5560693.1 ATP-binding cassette domain-containing protein [Streptomyces sp. NBC_00038]